MVKTYQHLGLFSDLVQAARRSQRLFPLAKPGRATLQAALKMLRFQPGPDKPRQVKVEGCWQADGVEGERLSWSVGYGPRTEAWLLKPVGTTEPLPGVVALHDHGGFKLLGKEKIACGPEPLTPVQAAWMNKSYGGRAWANELARRGFVVLVPDTFLWGSRRFPLPVMPQSFRDIAGKITQGLTDQPDWPVDHAFYQQASGLHEHLVQKYCHLLGTTLAGVIAYEDRVAAGYLASRKDVRQGPHGIGCVGLSGGGLRSTLLRATCPLIHAAVVVGLMTTYEGLLDHNVCSHTWMLFPSPNWSGQGDWTDLAACRAPKPLMVQYDKDDELFTLTGMKAAHKRIAKLYRSVGGGKNYVGQFYPGPHKFDMAMQEDAFDFLGRHLDL